jgi:nuclear pore complex protein Nup62
LQPTSTTATTTLKTSLTTTTPQVTSSSLSLTTQSTTATSNQTTTSVNQPPPAQMTFKQLEGYINVWLNELNQMESDFQTQSQTINSWDSLLVNNALKITNINENLDLLKEDHKRIDQQLDFVISQQNELEQLLEPLEKIQIDFNVNDTASTEREFTYSLVDTVSNDLQGIGTELQNFIKKLNETKANQDLNDPLSPIGKILNSHLDALQYIEHQISVLKRNIET